MSHKQRREAKYLAMGMPAKAEFARWSLNNRSKRSRGWMRDRVKWSWRGPNNNRFQEAKRGWLNYPQDTNQE